ncbi:vWA domain-containing protein [Profundibacterium mesophilum]|uniref:Protein containing von Willebrand factor type A domain General function prediction only n=1 Tax=Profundibacterium mesophilum KAUST100406-0324 TaxID=1037889 RepID=A0A921TC88_9RHOB|nr:VWA domain-containing protein [Profundibacterium mesophilum]KAF0676800.1 Protein containing von Willebrand factor type A domain General function prediction only [Profundibacterium mesophilum KAUST100406-0324]
MVNLAQLDLPEAPKLTRNILWFARALRRAGLPIGTGRALDAVCAVEAAGFTDRTDFYHVMQACFVSRPEQRAVFDQVFRLFWRDPRYLEQMMSLLVPSVRGVQEERKARAAEKRAAQALLDGSVPKMPPPEPQGQETVLEIDAARTTSATERLRSLDFEQMSTEEMAQARRMIARLSLPVPPLLSRRTAPDMRGAMPDWRMTMRAAMRRGGDMREMAMRSRRQRWPSLVALCDISGSMSHYSRFVLHFLHTVSNEKGAGWARVHSFTFGTRLTNITRHLARRDVDAALAAAGAEAQDWEGGTRIGACLSQFNRDWSRRVMGQGAIVLLVTDGLERDDPARLAAAMERLHLSARRVIWLNPLLRFDGFLPRARGIAAMLPHVDSFRAGHNIASLEALGHALSREGDMGEKPRMMSAL